MKVVKVRWALSADEESLSHRLANGKRDMGKVVRRLMELHLLMPTNANVEVRGEIAVHGTI